MEPIPSTLKTHRPFEQVMLDREIIVHPSLRLPIERSLWVDRFLIIDIDNTPLNNRMSKI